MFVMDQNRVTPSFRPNSDFILGLILPPNFWNVKYPVWDEDDINKSKTNVEEKYYAVAEYYAVSSAHLPPCASYLELPCPWLPAVLQPAGEQYCLQHTFILQ